MNTADIEMIDQTGGVQHPETNTQEEDSNQLIREPISRKEFLFKFYISSLISLCLTLVVFLLGFSDTLLQVVTVIEERHGGYHYTDYNHYKSQNSELSYNDYMAYLELSKYYITYHRWTYFLFLGLLIANTIIIVLGRSYRMIVNHQKLLLFSQSILLGLTMMGVFGQYRDNYTLWLEHCHLFINILTGFIANIIILITLAKIDKLKLYDHLILILVYSSFLINLMICLWYYYVEGYILFIELFTSYVFYYYQQLNTSLLQQPETLPEQENIIQLIKNRFNRQDEQQQQLLNAPQQKRILVYSSAILSILVVGMLIYISILSDNLLVKAEFIFGSASIISLVFDTQVASRTLQDQDHYYAASLQFIDMICPLKNLKRTYKLQ